MCTWKKRKTLFKKLSPRRLLLNFYIIDKCWWFQQELSNIKTKLVFTNFLAGYIFEGRGLFVLPAVRAFFNFDFNESLQKWQRVCKITCTYLNLIEKFSLLIYGWIMNCNCQQNLCPSMNCFSKIFKKAGILSIIDSSKNSLNYDWKMILCL